MRRTWPVFWLSLMLLDACIGYETYPCGDAHLACTATEARGVDDAIVDFEAPCAGAPARCNLRIAAGSADITDSFLPGDHALRLSPGGAILLDLSLPGSTDGASLSVNARCEDGGVLRFYGDGISGLPTGETLVTSASVWDRRGWSLRTPSKLRTSLSEARAGTLSATLDFRNEGSAPCSLDRIVYRTTALVCTRWENVRDQCLRGSDDSGSSYDSGWFYDSGYAVESGD